MNNITSFLLTFPTENLKFLMIDSLREFTLNLLKPFTYRLSAFVLRYCVLCFLIFTQYNFCIS